MQTLLILLSDRNSDHDVRILSLEEGVDATAAASRVHLTRFDHDIRHMENFAQALSANMQLLNHRMDNHSFDTPDFLTAFSRAMD